MMVASNLFTALIDSNVSGIINRCLATYTVAKYSFFFFHCVYVFTILILILCMKIYIYILFLKFSDDRSPEVFRTNLEAATQMKAVLHEDKRPNCLILDEIDGAPAVSCF